MKRCLSGAIDPPPILKHNAVALTTTTDDSGVVPPLMIVIPSALHICTREETSPCLWMGEAHTLEIVTG